MLQLRQWNPSQESGTFATVLGHVEKLVRLEAALFRVQLSEDLTQHRNTAVILIFGLLTGLVALGLVAAALVGFLTNVTTLPLWACVLIAAFCFSIASTLIFFIGTRKKDLSPTTESIS